MSDILKSLKEIVGERGVSTTPEELWFYSRDPGVLAPHLPDYVVAPKTTEQVQKVVQLANQGKDTYRTHGKWHVLDRPGDPVKRGHRHGYETDEQDTGG